MEDDDDDDEDDGSEMDLQQGTSFGGEREREGE